MHKLLPCLCPAQAVQAKVYSQLEANSALLILIHMSKRQYQAEVSRSHMRVSDAATALPLGTRTFEHGLFKSSFVHV